MRTLAVLPFDPNNAPLAQNKRKDGRFLQTLPATVVNSYADARELLNYHRFSFDTILTTYSPNMWLPEADLPPPEDRISPANIRDYYSYSRSFVTQILAENPFASVILWTGSGGKGLSLELAQSDRVHLFDRSSQAVLGGAVGCTPTEMKNLRGTISDSFTECRFLLNEDRQLVVEPVCGRSPISIKSPDSSLLLPARVYIQRALGEIESQIREFEELVNRKSTSERQIELFLREHDRFLLGNRYKSVRWQVHLQRTDEGKGDLIPDIILEPVNQSELWKIQDLKLPRARTVVSSNQNRTGFSSEIIKSLYQLREYRDFFDNPAYREQLEQLGISAYRPQISVIIGRDYGDLSIEQIVKARHDFPELEVITYSDLVQHVRSQLLWMGGSLSDAMDSAQCRGF